MTDLQQNQTTTGRIIAVHEDNLHVQTEMGMDIPLLIPHDSGIDVAQLRQFHEQGTLVTVHFDGSPGAHSGRARSVHPA